MKLKIYEDIERGLLTPTSDMTYQIEEKLAQEVSDITKSINNSSMVTINNIDIIDSNKEKKEYCQIRSSQE